MKMELVLNLLYAFAFLWSSANAFSTTPSSRSTSSPTCLASTELESADDSVRRSLLRLAGAAPLLVASGGAFAAVGSLEEFSDANAILQGVTVKVADKSQQDAMIAFLQDGFNFQVLRKRIRGGLEETWLGFGPEQLSIPQDFQVPYAFSQYGGHASIHLVYDTQAAAPLYRIGDPAPGNNIAYVQVGVPEYRVSQMVKNGGNILDAYGIINVVSPAGLPMRGIIGISPDPIMFVAINCEDVESSKAFYQRLGFIEQEYPYTRPNKGMGQIEPPQPSKSVYMAPSKNSMGVLLLPMKKRKQVTSNPAFSSLDIVYKPSTEADDGDDVPKVYDPSGVSVAFQSERQFTMEEKVTR